MSEIFPTFPGEFTVSGGASDDGGHVLAITIDIAVNAFLLDLLRAEIKVVLSKRWQSLRQSMRGKYPPFVRRVFGRTKERKETLINVEMPAEH